MKDNRKEYDKLFAPAMLKTYGDTPNTLEAILEAHYMDEGKHLPEAVVCPECVSQIEALIRRARIGELNAIAYSPNIMEYITNRIKEL